jgi:hypothetical protein
VVLDHAVPEEARRHEVGRVARVGKPVRRTDELGHLGVAVRAGQVVLVALERPDERLVLELVGQAEPALVARVG